jgi:hypothetical protein
MIIGNQRHTAYQILAFMLVALEKETAPPVVVGKSSLPLVQPSLHHGVFTVRLPRPQASVIVDGSPVYSSPVVMRVDERCKQRSSLVGNQSRVLQSRRRALKRRS